MTHKIPIHREQLVKLFKGTTTECGGLQAEMVLTDELTATVKL